MEELKFNVYKNRLTITNPFKPHIHPAADTVNYLIGTFDFDPTWDGFEKRVYFKNASYNIVKSILLGDSNSCYIPWEVLAHTGTIRCNIIGLKYSDNTVSQRITTNPVVFEILVDESILEPYDQQPLTPTEYEQFRVHFDDVYTSTVAAMEAAIEAEQDAESIAQDVSTYVDQAETYRLDSEAYALGSRNGSAVESDDPTYENNSKYYSEQAYLYMGDAVAAKVDAGAAKDAAINAQIDAETAEYNANISALDAEAYGAGTRNHVAVTSGDPAYHNNSKYYKEQAATSASDAYDSYINASAYAFTSQAYAVGKKGASDVPSTDPAYHNNSLYYSQQAGNSATAAANSAAQAATSVANSGIIEMTINSSGHLVYTRTQVVAIDFDINTNGHLVVKEAL